MSNLFDDDSVDWTAQYQQEPEYADVDRGILGDYGSTAWGALGEGIRSTGRGLQEFTGGEFGSSLEKAGDWIGETSFAKQDIGQFVGETGKIKQFGLDLTEMMVQSFTASAAGGIAGGLMTGGNPFAAAAGATAGLITQFGGGTYADLMESGAKEGLSGENLKDYAFKGALLEVVPELGDQVITVLTAGTLGLVIKGGRKGLITALKSGKVSPKKFTKELAKIDNGFRQGAINTLAAGTAGGGSELITSFGMDELRAAKGLVETDENKAYTFLLGFTGSGAPTAVGQAVNQSNARKRAEYNLEVLGSGKSTTESRIIALEDVYNALNSVDPKAAELFKTDSLKMIGSGGGINLGQEFSELYTKVKLEDNFKIHQQLIKDEEGRISESNVPTALLDGQTPNEVLEPEMSQLPPESTVGADVAAGITEMDTSSIGQPMAPVIDTGLTVNQKIDQQMAEMRTEQPRSPKGQAIAEQMPVASDISPVAPFVPETAQDRWVDYWSNPESRESYTLKQIEEVQKTTVTEVAKVLPKEEAKDIAQLLKAVDEPTQEAIAKGAVEIRGAKDAILSAPTVAEKSKAISEMRKKQKDLANVVVFSREEAQESFVSEEIKEEGETTEKYDELKTYDEDLKETGWTKRTYPDGTEVHKEGKDKYIVRLKGKQGVVYRSIKKATEAAETGKLEGKRPDEKFRGKTKVEGKKEKLTGVDTLGTQDWLKANGYVTSKGAFKSEQVGEAITSLLISGKELTKGGITKATKKLEAAAKKKSEYDRSSGVVMPSGRTGSEEFDPLDTVEEVTPEDEVVEAEAKSASIEDIAKATEKPMALRFHRVGGELKSEWKGSKYTLEAREVEGEWKVDLKNDGKIEGTFDSIQEASASIGAIIKGEENLSTLIETKVEKTEKPKKAKRVIVRRKSKKVKKLEYTDEQLESIEVPVEYNLDGKVIEATESAKEALEYIEDRENQLKRLLECAKG